MPLEKKTFSFDALHRSPVRSTLFADVMPAKRVRKRNHVFILHEIVFNSTSYGGASSPPTAKTSTTSTFWIILIEKFNRKNQQQPRKTNAKSRIQWAGIKIVVGQQTTIQSPDPVMVEMCFFAIFRWNLQSLSPEILVAQKLFFSHQRELNLVPKCPCFGSNQRSHALSPDSQASKVLF